MRPFLRSAGLVAKLYAATFAFLLFVAVLAVAGVVR